MKELYQQILNYLNSAEVEKKLQDILDANLADGQKDNFLKVWQKIKNLEFNLDDLYSFLIYFLTNDLEKASKLDDELFENIFIDVYDELIELYEENKKEPIVLTDELTIGKEEKQFVDAIENNNENNDFNLTQKYNTFTMSSLFQNILAAEEIFNQKYLVNGVLNIIGVKEEFYSSLNSADKIKTVAALRVLATQGVLAESFREDQRYLEFWGSFLARHYGQPSQADFLNKPIDKKYFVEFLRFVLEKRLNFNFEESPMIGMGLSALCAEAGEVALGEMAYGSEEKGKFEWNE